MRRVILPALLAVTGCAYYNGVYNAKSAAKTADRLISRGESFNASQEYALSAAIADTVLVRHPRTRWRPEALYLAGRGYALSGECARARAHLDEYLAIEGQPRERREHALVARAACLLAGNQLLAADTILAPLLESPNEDIRGEAALWAGRAALQLGDLDRAQSLLARAPGTAAAWEFLAAALRGGDLADAESLLVSRATAGDWRPEVQQHVRALWNAGRHEGAVKIADLYARSRAPTAERVRLRFLVSELAAGSGDTSVARVQAVEAQRLGISPAVEAEARARLLALRIRELDQFADVEAAIARDSARAQSSPLLNRLRDHTSLIRLLLANPNIAGAHLFLAAEIARDSLRAYRLAHTFLRAVERDYGDYEIAARALLAARAMFPESTAVYESRVREKWENSAATHALLGLDPSASTQRSEDAQLRNAWSYMLRQWSDTLRARRAADSIAAAGGVRRQ
jgi:hypothetical protein